MYHAVHPRRETIPDFAIPRTLNSPPDTPNLSGSPGSRPLTWILIRKLKLKTPRLRSCDCPVDAVRLSEARGCWIAIPRSGIAGWGNWPSQVGRDAACLGLSEITD